MSLCVLCARACGCAGDGGGVLLICGGKEIHARTLERGTFRASVCVCVRECVCVCVFIYFNIYTYTHAYVFMSAYIYIYI